MISLTRASTLILVSALLAMPLLATDWARWRGPEGDGTSMEQGLISEWSKEGQNLLWRVDFTGRSTPVVFDGRLCANGRSGEGIDRREMVACFDAETGEELWRASWNIYHTTVPWNRAGWPNPTIDPATGNLYVQGVGGIFKAFDPEGFEIWSYNLLEEFGFMEGYGGRTQTPIIDEDRVILTFCNSGWGEQGRPLHRIRAFDKHTGEVLMVTAPGGAIADKNTQSTPAVTVLDGQRMLIHGNADGHIYAVQPRSGQKIWGFQLSKRGINSSVLVKGDTVYASHGEENVDEGNMGRVVAIDATGSGDVTATHEKWRSPVSAGFSSPTHHDGRLFVLDNSANLHALDASTGEEYWEFDVGRVGKTSPVWADGKIYVSDVNGVFNIVQPGEDGAVLLDSEELEREPGRYAEIYGSAAVANGRVYFATEEGLYALGTAESAGPSPAARLESVPDEGDAEGPAASLVVLPAEARITPDASLHLEVEAFDAKGRSLGAREASWTVQGLAGEIDSDGRFVPDPEAGFQAGKVVAEVDGLSAESRVRVIGDLPIREDFETTEAGSRPSYMVAYVGRFSAVDQDGNMVLEKGPSPRKIHRHITFMGAPEMTGYTIQGDLMGTQAGRKRPDVGLINGGYTLELMGAHQRLEVRSWPSARRMAQVVDFPWEPDTWYTMKFRVDAAGPRAVLQGKVWPKGEPEPAAWTIEFEDPNPISQGSPGLAGYSPTPVYYDNIEVTKNP